MSFGSRICRWRLPVLAAIAALLSHGAPAASSVGAPLPGVFRQTDLDAGGWLTGFASHASGRLYARTDVGGAYRSDDRGASWRFISGNMTGGAGLFVQGLAVGEGSADLVYQAVGTSYTSTDAARGVWRSLDGGVSWTQVLTGVLFSGNDDLRWQGECLAITPGSNDQELFAISRRNGLWRSRTGGGTGTWSKEGGTLFDGLVGHVVHMHPSFPAEVLVGGIKEAGTSALYRGVRGAGGTLTWSAVTVNAATTSVTRLERLPSGVLFAAVQDGSANRFYRSDATGTTWTNITTSVLGGLSSNGPVGMCHVLRDGTTVVLGWIGGPTRRSLDGGATWQSVPLSFTGDRPLAMLQSDANPGWSRGSLLQDPQDADRWYLPNGFGPFVSTDAGATVSYMTRGIGEVVAWKPVWHPNDAQRVYLPVADLIGFIALDGSATGGVQRNPRRSLPVANGNVGMTYATRVLVGNASAGASPRVYFIGGANFGNNAGRACILRTDDDGASWSLVHVSGITGTGLPASCEIVSGALAPDNPDELLVAVHDAANAQSGLYRSVNGGVAFAKATGVPTGGSWGDEFSHFVSLETDPAAPARRFAWLNGVGFLLSNDRGATWASTGHASNGPSSGKLYSWNTWGVLTRDPVSGCLWFGGMSGHLGLAYSNDNGSTWTYLDTPFSNTGFEEIRAVDAHDGRLVVCGRRFGDGYLRIYFSDNNGAVWRECSKPGFRFPNTTYVALNPHRPGEFWVATNGRSYARFTPGTFGAWQQEHFDALALNDPALSGPDSDPDGDGQTNAFEHAADVDPLAAASRFTSELFTADGPGSQLGLRFSPRHSTRSYVLETALGPGSDAAWQPVGSPVFSDNGLTRTATFPRPPETQRFYRVRVEAP